MAHAKTQGRKRMTENEIATVVVDAAYKFDTALGPGLLESAYEALLIYELRKRGPKVAPQQPMLLIYDGVEMDVGYRADLVVEDKVSVELKSVERMAAVHYKQLLTYVRVSDRRLGLLINLGMPLISDGIRRVVNQLEE